MSDLAVEANAWVRSVGKCVSYIALMGIQYVQALIKEQLLWVPRHVKKANRQDKPNGNSSTRSSSDRTATSLPRSCAGSIYL